MNIGIDAKAFAKAHTGIAVYIESMIDWFQELAPENHYVLFSHIDFEMKSSWKSCKKVIFKSKITGSLSICYGLKELIDKYKLDIFWGPEHCIPLTKGTYKKVVTIHDIAVLINPAWGTTYNNVLQRFMVGHSLKAADRVVAISQSTKSDIIKKFGTDTDKIQVIYNGDSPYNYRQRDFSEARSMEIRKKYRITSSYFFYCGTIEPRKNIVTLVNAFNQYCEKYDKNTQLILCGGLGWKYKKILKTIELSPYKQQIIQTGYVSEEEKEFLYKFAIATLFPSYYEGLGLPVIESMSLGTPVITTKISSLPEVGGDVALYIDRPDNADDLCSKMHSVVKMNQKERKDLSNKCVNQAKRFSKKTCAEDLLRLFKEEVDG